MRYLYKFWPKPEIGNKRGVEEYLEYMAGEGYPLESLGIGTAKFKKETPQQQKYCIDFFRDAGVAKREYLQLCEDSGWELVDEMSYVYYFKNKSDVLSPVPLHTDEQVEKENFKATYPSERLSTIICIVDVLILLLGIFYYGPRELAGEFFLGMGAIIRFYIPLVLFVITVLYWQIKKRKITDGSLAKRYELFLNVSPPLYLSLFLIMLQFADMVINILERIF